MKNFQDTKTSQIEIREAMREDLDEIMQVEEEAWPIEARAPRDKFIERFSVFPIGFKVALLNNKIVGTTTSQIINYNPLNPPSSWTEITADGHILETHKRNGNALYVVSIGVSPRGRPNQKGIGVGSTLLESQKGLAKLLNLKYLVLSARVPGYNSYCKSKENIDIETYVNLRREDNLLEDMELRFYERLGLKQIKVCPNTMDDIESRNYGVMMEWRVK